MARVRVTFRACVRASVSSVVVATPTGLLYKVRSREKAGATIRAGARVRVRVTG